MLTWARFFNNAINVFGWLVSSLGLLLVLLQSLNVFNRYFFAQNKYFGLFTTFYDEVLLVGFSALFMLGSAFAFNRDAHVRVDILYAGLNPRGQASVNLIGILIFMIPMSWVIFHYSISNIEQAWKLAESGPNGDDGVTFFWLWKTMVPVFCVLTIIGGMNHLIQNFARMTQNVTLTNIVFGLAFVGLGIWGVMAAFDFSVDAAAWVEFGRNRKPTPEYRFGLWSGIVWAARAGCAAMIVAGACSVFRAIAGRLDPLHNEELLEQLNQQEAAPMGDA